MQNKIATIVALGVMATAAVAVASNTLSPPANRTEHDSEQPVASADADRAAQAALKATGGGTVQDVDRDGESGATWEVEITRPDGRSVDVLLDAQFQVLNIGDEQEAGEGADDADDRDEDDDD